MKILYAFFVSVIQTTRPAHHMPFDSIIQMNSDRNVPDMTFSSRSFLQSLVTHSPLGQRILTSKILFSDAHKVKRLHKGPTLISF
jgi:hypothetical protein